MIRARESTKSDRLALGYGQLLHTRIGGILAVRGVAGQAFPASLEMGQAQLLEVDAWQPEDMVQVRIELRRTDPRVGRNTSS